MTTKLFSELGLSPELLKAIDKLGFEQASPIQAEAIPVLMAGRDVVGQAQTGSGKTLAFAAPAIEKTDPHLRSVQVLILCPTRELAVQVSEEFQRLALFKRGIHALPIYGGQSYERQFSGLRQGAQIVIGTPGRVMDHMRRGTLRLEQVKMAILDEADVMLDMGFREDIEFILKAVPAERQTVFFSATMPRAIQELIQRHSRDPQSVRIEQKELTVPTVEQVYYEVDRRFKVDLLTRLIDLLDLRLGIIFCNTKRMVDDLVDHLNAQGYSADRLHGDMSQAMRDRVMNKFRKSDLEFLVATDVAARGIDVENVQVVFNYDLPYDAEDYLHRIGRTGRAGRSGRAISFVSGRELFQINHIERFIKVKIRRGKAPTMEQVAEAREGVFLGRLRVILQASEFKRQDHLIERLLEEGFVSTDIVSALIHLLQTGDSSPKMVEEEAGRERKPAPWTGERARPDAPQSSRSRPTFKEAPQPSHPRPVSNEVPRPSRPPKPTPKVVAPPVADRPSSQRELAKPATKTPSFPPISKAPSPPAMVEPVMVTPASTPPAEAPPPVSPPTEAPWTVQPPTIPSPKHSRRTPADQTRLYLNLGEQMGITAGDVMGAILGETGLPAKVVGVIDIRERHLFVDVAAAEANGILAKLNRAQIKHHKVKAKIA